MEEEGSINIVASEKVLKKMTRKERRDRHKKKRADAGESFENGDNNVEEKNNEENTKDQSNNDNSQLQRKKNLCSSGSRAFASNPVLYKPHRKEQPKQKLEKEENSNESEHSQEIEKLKNELFTAVEGKDISRIPVCIQRLKEFLPDINFRYSDGLSLLHKAIQISSTELIQLLIDNGAVIQFPSITGLSPLHFAAQLGDLQCVEFLISKNANPMQRDIENKSCLHAAVIGGNLSCVELILKQPGVLINHRDNVGCSALHHAVKMENKDIVDFLLSKGADPLLLDQLGSRPIDYIPGYSRYLSQRNIKLSHEGKKVFKLLKKKGGHRLPVVTAKSDLVMGGGLRSRSLDHRNPIISADFARNLQNSSIPNHFQSAPSAEKKIQVKEKDLELLYYNPTTKTEEQHPEPVSLPPIKKTDKYGFYTSKSECNSPKHSTIVKEEKRALKWLEIIKNWEEAKPKKIQKYCDKGIPDSVRGMVWKLLAGCEEDEGIDYQELLQRDSIPKVKEQILKDIARTMPNHILFQEKGQGQQMLTNVLTAYSVYKPEIGYCQGMGFITAMFLMYMPEEDAFWMLNRIAQEYRFARLWDEHMALVSECIYALGVLMQQNLPEVQTKLEEDNIPAVGYVPQFFITGFLYSLPFPMVVRIWDCFLLRKFDYLYAVAIALFKVTKDKLMKMKMEQVLIFLRFKDSGEELDFTVDQLLKTATAIWSKLSSPQIRKLEEEGGRIRAAEKERRNEATK